MVGEDNAVMVQMENERGWTEIERFKNVSDFFFSFGFELGIFLLFSCIGIARVFFAKLKRLLGNFPV